MFMPCIQITGSHEQTFLIKITTNRNIYSDGGYLVFTQSKI